MEAMLVNSEFSITDGRLVSYKGNDRHIVVPDSVSVIGDFAFRDCGYIVSVAIPDTVTAIGCWVFSGCRKLESVTVPDTVTALGEGAFSGCISLKSVNIPPLVTAIGDGTFSGCRRLENIEIPDAVKTIGYRAFKDCSSLTGITIPSTVKRVEERAFRGCQSLKRIALPDSAAAGWEAVFGYNAAPSEIIVDNLSLLPDEMKPYAAIGYAMHPYEGGAEREALHLEYIDANAAELVEYPEFMRLMLEKKLLTQSMALKYLETAAGRKLIATAAALLEYTRGSASSVDTDGWKL